MSSACLRTVLACAAVLAGADAALAEAPAFRNLTAGGPLRHGVYGRIEVRGAKPPPVIFKRPVIASKAIVPAKARPVYLYVPPGQVRKWKQFCTRWSACDKPVLFVRMDASPSRWGRWRQLREPIRADFVRQDRVRD